MNSELLKQMLDACFEAKKITESMKELPGGMKPRHIHVIDCIDEIGKEQQDVRVSDVSARLKITMPSVTKLIQELEKKQVVIKYPADYDKRVTLLRLTDLGKQYEEQYVTKYHSAWSESLNDVTEEQAQIMIKMIERLKESMPKERKENEGTK